MKILGAECPVLPIRAFTVFFLSPDLFIFSYRIVFNACSISLIISSASSMPTDSFIKSDRIPMPSNCVSLQEIFPDVSPPPVKFSTIDYCATNTYSLFIYVFRCRVYSNSCTPQYRFTKYWCCKCIVNN